MFQGWWETCRTLPSIQKFCEVVWVIYVPQSQLHAATDPPPCLGADPWLPHEKEEFPWDPRRRCFPSPATSGEHLESPSQDREMLFCRKHITYFSFISPSPPGPQTPWSKLPLESLPLSTLVSALSGFPHTQPSRMQNLLERPLFILEPIPVLVPNQKATSSRNRVKECCSWRDSLVQRPFYRLETERQGQNPN